MEVLLSPDPEGKIGLESQVIGSKNLLLMVA